jgi:hypothetical protein
MEGEDPGDLQKEEVMIKVEHIDVQGFEAAVRGMRNPMNSWEKSDSYQLRLTAESEPVLIIGDADLKLMKQLLQAGPEHRKYLRMITVYMDITAPLYWWKEYDTYKVSTVANSCSTMHKITSKPIEVSDFSMDDFYISDEGIDLRDCFINVVADCEMLRNKYLETKDKRYWRGLIQLLPSSYNQKRTVMFNYETALTMIRQRSGHKLDEWKEFVRILQEELPYMRELMKP